jgi:urease accessory protein
MVFGGILGALEVQLPAIEIGVTTSAIVFGAMVMLAARPPTWSAAMLVGVFAILHGHAHGTELPQTANLLSYAAGFVIATVALHALGILIALAWRYENWQRSSYARQPATTSEQLLVRA